MAHEVLLAGFGGQGVLLAGRLLAYAGMIAGKEVSWIPAYGPEMRGGTASCSVIIDDGEIGSPIVTKPSALVAMNAPSLHKFEKTVRQGGIVIVNSSLIDHQVTRGDIKVHYVPMNDIALSCGNVRFLNMVALGALVGATSAVHTSFLQKVFDKQFGSKPGAAEGNLHAAMCGAQCVINVN